MVGPGSRLCAATGRAEAGARIERRVSKANLLAFSAGGGRSGDTSESRFRSPYRWRSGACWMLGGVSGPTEQMDTLTAEQRSERMALIRSKDTRPELLVRRSLHALGYRSRLHRRDLSGAPDLVFPSRKTAVFVHGCFWHGHEGCKCPRNSRCSPAYLQCRSPVPGRRT